MVECESYHPTMCPVPSGTFNCRTQADYGSLAEIGATTGASQYSASFQQQLTACRDDVTRYQAAVTAYASCVLNAASSATNNADDSDSCPNGTYRTTTGDCLQSTASLGIDYKKLSKEQDAEKAAQEATVTTPVVNASPIAPMMAVPQPVVTKPSLQAREVTRAAVVIPISTSTPAAASSVPFQIKTTRIPRHTIWYWLNPLHWF